MKRTVLVLLIAVFCLCFCACGGNNDSDPVKDGKSDSEHTCSGKEWVVKEEASCAKDGTKENLCECGKAVTTEPIPAHGHNYVKGVCEACGEKDPDYVPGPSEGLVFESHNNGHYYKDGVGTCSVIGIGSCTDENLWIPEKSPEGEWVVSIRYEAFSGNTSLKSVYIPSIVNLIGNRAFEGCTGLKAVYGGEGVETIGNSAFMGCAALSDITFGEGLTKLDDAAFKDCASLEGVELPSALERVGSSAFSGCTSLKTVSMKNCTYIFDYAFAGCTSLTDVELNEGITGFGSYAFSNCTALTEIVIPSTVTLIWDSAFECCTSLSYVYLNSPTMISCKFPFDYCPLVKIIVPDSVLEEYRNDYRWGEFHDIRGASAPDVMPGSAGLEFTSNDDGTCYVSGIGTCTDTAIVIPESSPAGDRVTKIGGSAFENCSDITQIVIPSSVTEIGANAFMYCSSLESLDIPESVTMLGGSMIYGCHNLKKMTIRSASVLNYPEPSVHAEDDTYERMVVYVPADLVEEYRNTIGWMPFEEKIQAIIE